MELNLDITSLLAGISITAIAGWVGSFFSLRKDERAIQMEQITKERTKWRDNMRKLTEEIVATYYAHKQSPMEEKAATCRSRLVTALNPKDVHDKELLLHFDVLFNGKLSNIEVFTDRVALLLKHDWERVKWECTPIYLKPFLFFEKRHQDWRSDEYRKIIPAEESPVKDDGASIDYSKSKADKFLLKLIDIKIEDINLKFVFDNLRNYSIAAMIVVAGFYLAKHGGQVSNFPGAGIVFGLLLVATGFLAYCLNLVQAIWALIKLKMRFAPYFIISMILFLGTSELLWVLVRQLMAKV